MLEHVIIITIIIIVIVIIIIIIIVVVVVVVITRQGAKGRVKRHTCCAFANKASIAQSDIMHKAGLLIDTCLAL